MKLERLPLALCAAASLCLPVPAGAADLVLPRPSPKASLTQTVGITDITVTYSRPGVKGRVIWGDLVPYNKVWRTGANEATVISFSDDVLIQGQKLAAGKYSLHTIPSTAEWTIIFNKEVDQWGSYSYDPKSDALRVAVVTRPGPFREWMTFHIPDMSASGDTCELVLAWDKLEVPIPIRIATVERAFAAIDKALAAAKTDSWRVPYRAADFAFNADTRLSDAMAWVDQSLAAEVNYFNLQLKAKLLARSGDVKGAIATAEKALALQKSTNNPPDTAALDRLLAGWKAGKK